VPPLLRIAVSLSLSLNAVGVVASWADIA